MAEVIGFDEELDFFKLIGLPIPESGNRSSSISSSEESIYSGNFPVPSILETNDE
jgi:hypothetical protein